MLSGGMEGGADCCSGRQHYMRGACVRLCVWCRGGVVLACKVEATTNPCYKHRGICSVSGRSWFQCTDPCRGSLVE